MDPPWDQSRDDFHTTTQNLPDEPTLANGTPSTRAEMTCIPLHKTLQMNLLWLNKVVKGLKALAFTISEIPNSIFSKHIFAEKVAFFHSYFGQWTLPGTRAEMTSIPLHKTCQMNLLWPMEPPVPEQR